MPFKDISYLELWRLLCLAERNHLFNFGVVHHQNYFEFRPVNQMLSAERNHLAILVEGILTNSVKFFGPVVLEEIQFKDISYLELWQPFC